MHPVEIANQLENMVCLADTREQPTARAKIRLKEIGLPIERVALKFGDYSARCPALDLSDKVAIERKMDLAELCGCYCHSRDRFAREFLRAKDAGAKVYLLIENASWEKAYRGQYRSKMRPESLVASLTAWLARYNCQLIFCEEYTSGKLIHDILYREMKERLEQMEGDFGG